ncbi:integron gene cassette protein [Hyphomicrobium denitrificans 1NES1]|uniref:Integron gene cassette protein n=1 Tax=Hyphomicrobium denitrificans 1NES1 TaxID=670307 RepID=N0B3L6_9HYPH|nr:integron gene cassette protein [Hyphomicrobium denitrificans 1NES1]
MSNEPKHRRTGETLSEVISQYPGELDLDAVGIWQIVPGGRANFGLSGNALTDYVRRAILALLDAGAVCRYDIFQDRPMNGRARRNMAPVAKRLPTRLFASGSRCRMIRWNLWGSAHGSLGLIPSFRNM